MHLLIAAAGSGRRMGADRNKLLLHVAGKAILSWTLDSVFKAECIEWIGVIGNPRDEEAIKYLLKDYKKKINWIEGGNTRQESVERGLNALPTNAKYVLIHDGARCLVEPSLFDRCANEVLKGDAVISATPVTDTIKRVNEEKIIVETPLRQMLWAAQTPQAFDVNKLKEAHRQALNNKWEVTDDAALFERLDLQVRILESSPSNIKVTTKFDLIIAEAVLAIKK